jgi:Cdc6-like AAA superfamily ATPase
MAALIAYIRTIQAAPANSQLFTAILYSSCSQARNFAVYCLQVLYQLFDWPSQPGSRLAIIGISNTHDLDQRVLPRIASRLDQAKLAFAPYSAQQLVAIVQDRLEGSGVGGAVDESAVQHACRKVAAETGGCG